ncbi:beta strand repeat-containing protein, partial [Marinospirillum alkaliphilum]
MKKKHNPSCGSTSQCTSELFRLVPTALAAALLALGAAPVRAGVTGGEVISGSGSIEQPNGNTTNVYQHSHRLAVKWDTFNVGTNDTVNFYQPSSSSFVLNQIMDANASVIRGQINANGNVILVNANGIYFSASSQLNVGSLIASGHSLSVDDFMAGYLNFQREAGSNGSVINRGTINAATGGSVTLLGSSVENSGLIHAQAGRVNLAVGERITVDFDGDGLMRFVVDEALQENLSGLDTAILNTGSIQANGGSVLIEGRVAQDIFSRVVNNEGIIQAGRIENTGGEIRLVGSGGSDSSVVNTGQISASALDGQSNGGQITLHAEDGTLLVSGESRIEATSEHQQGGQIHLLGQQIGLSGTTQVDASGATGGGEILIGGDYQGKNTDIPNADKVIVTSDVSLNADATDNGDGGRIIVWADDWTRFAGNLSARGGDNGGDGGFAEVSGKNNLAYSGMADLRAPMGETGTLLLDPENITIVDGLADSAGQDDLLDPTPVISFDQIVDNDPDPDITNFTISNGTINAQLANVILQATNDIIQNADAAINIAETGVGITLQAGRHITLNGGITTSGGHIHLEADSPHHAGGSAGSNGTGTLTLGGSGLASNGGHITLIGNDFAINQDVNAGAGNINLARTQNAALGIGTGGSSQLSIAEFNRLESNGTITLGQARTAATDGLGESGLNNGIELLSSSITLNAALTTTASSDTILLISNGNITFGNNAVVASSSGGLTLHSLTGNISTGRAITAGDLVLNAGGDITTNSSHALAGSSILLEAGGDIGTSGARVTTSTNNLTAIAGGSAWITNTGTDATTLAGSAVGTFDVAHSGTGSSLAIGSGTNAAGSTINGINAGSVKIAVTGANNHLTVNQAIQSNAAGGHIELTSAGNITTAANLAATDGNILLTATNTTINLNSGTLTANAANRFIHLTAASIEQHAAHGGLVTQGLRLNSANAGHLNLHSNTNQIQTLAASIIGAGSNLSLNNNQALTIGTVDGLTGITTASGNLTLDVNGVLTANANITNSNSGSNIHLKASSFELLAGEISTNNGGLRMEAMSNSDGGNAINQNSGHRINTSALLLLLSGSGNNRNIHLGGTTNTIGRVAGRHTETDKSIGGITLVNSNNIEIGTITDPLTPGGLGDITGIQSQSLNITASNITLAADVTTTGTQTYTGAVTLA